MLMTIAAILFVLWILGLIGHVAAGFIHILLVVAIVLFIWHLVTGRRHTV
ncbi:MAG TPA: lmo0937 family membrane protein [Candidatus Saccharimonadales bacterium]|nr:lmo0937 family membrane protein [Candidatus Saccharimonadales bacterium]